MINAHALAQDLTVEDMWIVCLRALIKSHSFVSCFVAHCLSHSCLRPLPSHRSAQNHFLHRHSAEYFNESKTMRQGFKMSMKFWFLRRAPNFGPTCVGGWELWDVEARRGGERQISRFFSLRVFSSNCGPGSTPMGAPWGHFVEPRRFQGGGGSRMEKGRSAELSVLMFRPGQNRIWPELVFQCSGQGAFVGCVPRFHGCCCGSDRFGPIRCRPIPL